MPIRYARRLAGRSRSPEGNRHLGCMLAGVAGFTNAVGFGLLGHYTSHMTGMVSTFGERVVAGDARLALAAAVAIGAFATGSACCTVMIHHARRRRLHAQFAWPLLVEAMTIAATAFAGPAWGAVCLLAFAMGLQNALITKISRGEIRTTHVTGIVTDLGIEWGRGVARRFGYQVAAHAGRARLLSTLLALFALGCIAGTLAARHTGSAVLLPVALAVGVIALVPALDDLIRGARRRESP